MVRWTAATLTLAAALAIGGCESDDPVPTDSGLTDGGMPPDDGGLDAGHDAGGDDAGGDDGGVDAGVECMPLATDYSPGADDMWPPCISDDGAYHNVEPTISTIARVMSFEEIATLLFDPNRDPTPEQFTMARMIYQVAEGLDSRVVRRYDPHYTAPEGTDCTAVGVPAMYPDYCIGPSTLQPVVLDALAAGATASDPTTPSRVHAARIEGALLYFLAVSPYKESLTCTTTAKDCDSSYAYYTGGEAARGGIGLARYVREVDPAAHDRAWDGILAVRCWRDLDDATVATMLEMRERARQQYDRALMDGVAAVIRDRLLRFDAATGDAKTYWWEMLRVFGPVLDVVMEARAPDRAAIYAAELARTDPATVDVAAAIAAIDAVFDCP